MTAQTGMQVGGASERALVGQEGRPEQALFCPASDGVWLLCHASCTEGPAHWTAMVACDLSSSRHEYCVDTFQCLVAR